MQNTLLGSAIAGLIAKGGQIARAMKDLSVKNSSRFTNNKPTANMRLPKQQQVDIMDAAEVKRLRKQARFARNYKGD